MAGCGPCSRILLSLSLLLVVVEHALGHVSMETRQPRIHASEVYEKEFEAFKQRFSKHYESPEEEKAHFEAFVVNFDRVEAHKATNASYSLAINAFSDLTPEEFARTHITYKRLNHSEDLPILGVHEYGGTDLPPSVDWHQAGAATHVKDQQRCGGCWAFSSIAAIEGAWYIATNKKQSLSLSEQQLIDCVPSPSTGCGGGNPAYAFQYLQSHGICTEGSYSFTTTKGQHQTCKKGSCTEGIPVGGLRGSKMVVRYDPRALMSAVTQQPIAVAIEAENSQFSLYHNGVWKACGNDIDHSVLLVGYGREGNEDYWLIQNSWGSSWGNGGFGKILRTGSKGYGTCGILMEAQFPVVDGSKIDPNMNPVPVATYLLVVGAIAAGLAVIAIIFMLVKKACCKNRRAAPAPVRATSIQPIARTGRQPLVVPTQPARQPAVKTGNSRNSRLVQQQQAVNVR